MIQIVNVTPNPQPTGLHTYEVRINGKVITTFEHYREDDLSTCLERAARAVGGRKDEPYKYDMQVIMDLLNEK